MPLVFPEARPSSTMEPRQSATVPNVSKTSALGMTDTLADRGFGRPATTTPALKPFNSSLRFMVARIIYNAFIQREAQCECFRLFKSGYYSSCFLLPQARSGLIIAIHAFRELQMENLT